MKKILFVCTGNTCRSPMAKALFEKLLCDDNINDINVDSAGISAADGEPASQNAIMALNEEGIDISSHRAKKISEELIVHSDVIIALSGNHKDLLSLFYPSVRDKVIVLGEGITDPYGGDLDVYRRCRDEIKKHLYTVLDMVKE